MNAVQLKNSREESQLELLFAFSEDKPKAVVIPFESPKPWSEEGIKQLREELLWYSLRVLADGRAGP